MVSESGLVIRSGPWAADGVGRFLTDTIIPIRLATQGRDFPLVQSLWYRYDDTCLWCCTQADSVLARRLAADGRCAFEVSGDSQPYRGVRGTGLATLHADLAADLLPRLLERYAITAESPLAGWLLSRLDREVAVQVSDLRVTSWDYSDRMAP